MEVETARSDELVNILLVADQPAKLSYEAMLGELGENLVKAHSVSEALQCLLNTEIAVILIDVGHELDGFELATLIRDNPRHQRTAIIFVSSIHMSDLDRLCGSGAGAVDYVPVPVVPGLLRAKVRVFAELYRKTRQLELLNAELDRRVEHRAQEREAALAQMHEMQKMDSLGQLTGGVAHDFNNLLMVILGNLEILRRSVPDDPRIIRLIDGAMQGAERGTTLTRRMQAFARRQELRPEALDVAKLLASMEEIWRRTLGPSIDIATVFHDDLPAIRVDPNQLELALLNLVLNARDAMPTGGRLALVARRMPAATGPQGLKPGDYVCIAVRDSGTGMDEMTVRRAPEPFFTTKGAGNGTGFGLSMVHGLAAQSDGAMRIVSRLGEGTTVELWLPVSQPIIVNAEPKAAASSDSTPHWRVLVVDDDQLIAMATTDMLEELGHSVVEASSGQAALDLLRQTTDIDLVVTDQAMPGMTGSQLARQIKSRWPDLPVILATGYADLPNQEDDGWPRLSKPYRRDDLAAAIASVFGLARSGGNVVALDHARRA